MPQSYKKRIYQKRITDQIRTIKVENNYIHLELDDFQKITDPHQSHELAKKCYFYTGVDRGK